MTSELPKPIEDLGVDADPAIALEIALANAHASLAAFEEAIDRVAAVGGSGDEVVARVLVGLRAAVDQLASVPGADSPLSQLRLKFAAARELIHRHRTRGADGG